MRKPKKRQNNLNRNDGNDLPLSDLSVTNKNKSTERKTMKSAKLIVSGIALLIVLVLTLMAVKIVTIEGNQLGVLETWSGGVDPNILQPKTYFMFPGWTKRVYHYDASSQVFVMNDKPMSEEKTAKGRETDSYLVQSQEGQDMKISMNLRWRIDPSKLVQIHKTVRNDIEEKIIRPVVMRVVKDEATKMKAIDAYSGNGLVDLQRNIQNALAGGDTTEGKELRDRGIIVENFVIEHIGLDPNYVAEIVKKQIAVQQQLRAVEEQKAAEAEALVAKAKAQADLNTQVVAADRDAQITVIRAKASNEQTVIAAEANAKQVEIAAAAAAKQVEIAAEANKQQLTLDGEGQKARMTAVADGTLAQGKAEAAARQLMLEAYAVKGADSWVKVEVSKNVAAAFQNIKGYLPSDMKVNLLTGNFNASVDALTGNPIVTVPYSSTNSVTAK